MKPANYRTECPQCGTKIQYIPLSADTQVVCPECASLLNVQTSEPAVRSPATQELIAFYHGCLAFYRRYRKFLKGVGLFVSVLFILWWLAKIPADAWAVLAVLAGALTAIYVFSRVYFAPTLIARRRSHRNTPAIEIINLLLGWTVLGWIVALVWAVYEEKPDPIRKESNS